MERTPLFKLIRITMFVAVVCGVSLFCSAAENVFARAEVSVPCAVYEFGEKDHYDISASEAVARAATVGKLTISNASANQSDGLPAYDVKGEKATITYVYSLDRITAGADGWSVIEDRSKKVNGEELDKKIMNGAIVVQTSVDGNKWITDRTITNVFTDGDEDVDVFEPNEVQMANGCYIRILVVYREQKKVSGGLFVNFFDNTDYAYRKRAEVYEFRLTNSSMDRAGTQSPEEGRNRNEYHQFYAIKKKRGEAYSISKKTDVGENDPHLSWELGYFVVNGYSQLVRYDGEDVYLKTPGDKVTLWFRLVQDIDRLNKKENLSISDDTSRVDSDYNIESNAFRHGALIVKHTNAQGTPKTSVYTDFLLANTKTGANTKLVINEEGTYEVALDYEIRDSKGIDSYNGYKLICKFSVRNGSSMFYPFDAKTNSELSDKAYTKDGFRIDLAQSASLDIKVYQFNVQETENGIVADLRKNGVKAEEAVYREEGIYTLTVRNRYADDSTTKTIYVGDNRLIEKLWVNGIDVSDLKELNEKLNDGWYFDEETLKLQRKQEEVQELPPDFSVAEIPLEQPVEPVALPQSAPPPEESNPAAMDAAETASRTVLPPAEPEPTQRISPVIIFAGIGFAGGGALLVAHRKKAAKQFAPPEKPIEIENYAIDANEEGDEE